MSAVEPPGVDAAFALMETFTTHNNWNGANEAWTGHADDATVCEVCGGGIVCDTCEVCGTVLTRDPEAIFGREEAEPGSDILFRDNVGTLQITTERHENNCMKTVRKYAHWSACCEYRTRMLCKGFAEIEAIGNLLHLPACAATLGHTLFAMATRHDDFRNKRRMMIACAALICACRQCNVMNGRNERTYTALYPMLCAKRLTHTVEMLMRCVGPEWKDTQVSARDVLPVLCARMGLGRQHREAAQVYMDDHSVGNDAADGCFRPATYAAACLAQVSKLKKSSIAHVAGISAPTLRKCMRHLASHRRFVQQVAP